MAVIPRLPGCTGDGETAEAALADLPKAFRAWVATAKALGREIPPPDAQANRPVPTLVRWPRTLHAEVTRAAEHEGVSFNTYVTTICASVVATLTSDALRLPKRSGTAGRR